MLQPSLQDCEMISSYIESSNEFYQKLLGYKPEQTSLQEIPKNEWLQFTNERGLNKNLLGIYLPRNQTAVIQEENLLSLFHEYFGHGLYCEQSLSGRILVDLERKLLEEEKQEFQGRQFTLKYLQKFRQQNKTFQELEDFKEQNLMQYELFAIWTEYLLSGEHSLRENFERKYDSLQNKDKKVIDSVINFSKQYGNLATFYAQGMARRITPERVKKLLEDIYGKEKINNSKLILLTGSKKSFSDIDLFASSNYLQSTKNNWLDLVVFKEVDFEKRVKLFEAQITHPIISGEFVAGDKDYLDQKRKQLQEQPITEKAIRHNLNFSIEQEKRAYQHPNNSKESEIGLSYSKTYLANAFALREGKRLFTKEDLIFHLKEKNSHSEKFIELKGGIE